MADLDQHAAPNTGTASSSPVRTKHRVLWGLFASVLVIGAVLAGVFGSKSAPQKRRPIPIEKVTYSMVTEGLMTATVQPVAMPILATQTQNAAISNRTTATASSSKGNGPPVPTTIVGKAFESLKNMVGAGPSTPKFDPSAMVLPEGAVAVPSWKALGDATFVQGSAVASGRVICYPKTGEDVLEMASGEYNSPCEVLIFTNDRYTPYSIPETINITRPILMLGRPIRPPMLNSTNRIVRLFDVLPGGRLETRSLTLVRGFGYNTGLEDEVNVVAGSIVRVHVGGYFTATGCVLRERNNTRHSFEEEVRSSLRNPMTRSRQFGQLILVLGGRLHLTGCSTFRFRPFGNGVLNAVVIGRDVNVVAGYAVLTGHMSYSGSLYTSSFWVSGSLALGMGGVIVFVGGNNVGSNLVQFQVGWSCQLGTFGGVLATIGWGYTSTNGVLFRFNGGQFGGIAGVSYMTGFVQGRAWGIAVVFGPGQSYAQAVGMYIWHGGATCSYAISTAYFGVGGSTYIGAGNGMFNGIPQARATLTASASGCGLYNFVGAGTLTHIYLPSYSVNLVRFNAGVGTDFFVGMGWANNINCTRFSLQLANSFFGFGNQAYVGIGGAVFIRSYSNSRRRVNYGWPTTFTYTVGGNGVSSAGTKGQNLVMTKNGVTRYIYNKTSKSVTKFHRAKVQETASPTTMGGGKWSRKMMRRKTQEVAAATTVGETATPMAQTMNSWLKNIVEATGGVDPAFASHNKIVVLQTTIMEGRSKSFNPPHPDKFKSAELKSRWGGYATIMGDGLVEADEDADGAGGRNLAKDDGSAGYHPGLISANNSECFLCSVRPGRSADHIGGPGSCEVNENCDAENPVDAYAQAQRLTTKNILPPNTASVMPQTNAAGNAILPNTWLLWSELVVYCKHQDPNVDDASVTEDCLTKEYVTEVIKSFIALNATTGNEYQITVSQSGLHGAAQLPNFAPDANDVSIPDLKSQLVPAWNPECQGWTKYDIQVTSTETEAEQHLLDVFEEFYNDPTDLGETIMGNWDGAEDLQPCGLTVTEKGEQRFPSIKSMPPYKPSLTSVLAPDVTVADDVSIIPIKTLVPGGTYKIYVQNFPKGIKLNIKLLNGFSDDEPVVATIDSFDDDGLSEVLWTAPSAGSVSTGKKYYLQVQPADFPALLAFSQLFSFKDPAMADKPNPWMFDLKNL